MAFQTLRRKSAFNNDRDDLQDHFSQAGSVIAVNIMQDRATGRSRGFAFIEWDHRRMQPRRYRCFTRKIFRVAPSR